MAYRNPAAYQSEKIDWKSEILSWIFNKFLWIGIIGTVVTTGLLVWYVSSLSTSTMLDAPQIANVTKLLATLRVLLVASLVSFGLGMTYQFWGDFALPLTLILTSALYYFAPSLLVMIGWYMDTGGDKMLQLAGHAASSLQLGGIVLGIGAIVLQIIDGGVRLKNRSIHGVRDEQVKYGKEVKEEPDYQNVFMGKCWQLPYCRKFVREQCPIFHSRRTCWRERVGCMCEEEVIRGALEGKVIPRDVVAAAKFIPQNNRYTPAQKAERCRQCVIYNEHQRHKYRLSIPIALLAVAGFYGVFHNGLLQWTNGLLRGFDTAMSSFTLETHAGTSVPAVSHTPGILEEIILVLILLFILSQIMKIIEFSIFRLKI